MMLRSSAIEWSTAVRCATGVSVVSVAIRPTMLTVRSREEPPAPYVMQTKFGSSGSSRRMASQSFCSPTSVRGGMNSKEKERFPAARSSRTVSARSGLVEAMPSAMLAGYPAPEGAGQLDSTIRDK